MQHKTTPRISCADRPFVLRLFLTITARLLLVGLFLNLHPCLADDSQHSSPDFNIAHVAVDWADFLGRHDLVWDRIPNRWEVAPYTGNGNVGFLFYQAKGEAKNVISLYAGRHDYYDHRLPDNGQQHLWIYRCRLPLGRFNLESRGDITGVDLRLDLWNADLTGTVTTTEGAYQVRGLTHSETDVIYFETESSRGEAVKISWHPEVPYSSVRKTLEGGGGPKGGSWDAMREAPYPLPPESISSQEGRTQFCLQPLHEHRGETTTGWEVSGDAAGKQRLLASIHHSFPEKNSQAVVKDNLIKARALLENETFISSHQTWWHRYYPQSFLTINDAEKEAFYWIQMYKLGSAMRENGPILDLMGPWYHSTFWPMVWGDLNVQLIYWTHLTANRMAVGESLPNNLDKYADNLTKNVPERWKDSAALGPLFPQDCLSFDHGKVPDMLAWVLNNYWLHCQYAGDRERMRDKLFPLLRKNVNGYLNYLRENPVKSARGTIHIRQSWSPEYPGGNGQDINFTIGLLRWACQTLLDINAEHNLNDPLASQWQNIVDNLVDFQVDENGLRIGKDIPFEIPHRHYSHLLGFFPLAVLTPEQPDDAKMLRKTIDHWLDVSINRKVAVNAMPVTGYTATGAASMYAWLGDAAKAYQYLDYFIQHKGVSPTTMYAEGNPVIESPLSFATSLHDMLLQSWGGTLRVFRGTPARWTDVTFHQLRGQGAFLVSAKKKGGVTQFVSVESLIGSPCRVQTDIPDPKITIDGKAATEDQVTRLEGGVYEIALNRGQRVTFTPVLLEKADLAIAPVPVGEADRNLFGLNEKTTRLPGHQFYYPEAAEEGKPVQTRRRVNTRRWLPGEIGTGAFSLRPDQSHVYKTVMHDGKPAELKLQTFLPQGHQASDKRPAIVLFHGGGWYGGTPDHLYPHCRYFALRGMVALSVQYRTIKTFKTTPKECVTDGKSAVRWVRQHAAELGIDPARLVVGGSSAGGHVAAATALVNGFEEQGEDLETSCRPNALVLYNPVFDNGPGGFAHGLVKEYWKEISPIDNIDAQAPPSIVILGTEDEYIPAATGRRFQRLMKEKGRRCDLHLYEGKPHGFANLWVSREDLAETLVRVDRFLASLGYLQGEPIFKLTSVAAAPAGSNATELPAQGFGVSGYTYEQPAFKKGSRVLFIGDSITDMNRDRRPNTRDRNHYLGHSYAFLLAGRLGVEMSEAQLDFYNRGISGNTVSDLRARWQTDVIDVNPDILTILVGVNDAYRNVEPEAYEADYRHILTASRQANSELKLVLLDPFVLEHEHVGEEKRLTTRRIATDKYGKVVARLAKEFDAVHIRTQEIFDDAADAVSPEYWLWDGVHPLSQGHELIARHWLKEVSARWPQTP